MAKLTGSEALAVFLTEAEKLLIAAAEAEAKSLGQKFLPDLIAKLQTLEANLGKPMIWQVSKELEEAAYDTLVELAQAALAWCNS